MLRMTVFYFYGFEAEDKQKNEMLDIMDEA